MFKHQIYAKSILIALVGFLASCVSVQPKFKEFSPLSQIQLRGFAITSPNEKGWYILQNTRQAVQLAKQGDDSDETYAVQAWELQIPIFHNNDEFIVFVTKSMEKDTPSERFTHKKKNIFLKNTEHGMCVKFDMIYEDKKAQKRTNNPNSMLLEVKGLTCRNPKNQKEAAHIAYSHRHYQGDNDLSLDAKASDLINTLRFN